MTDSIADRVRTRSRPAPLPSGGESRSVSLRDVAEIAAAAGVSRRAVEIAALAEGIVPLRYLRNLGTLGIDGLRRLRGARAGVVGAGGLGGALVEILARIGIGAIVIIDPDSFTEDNLNRQLLCDEGAIGAGKADAAARRIARINSAVDVVPLAVRLDDGNADSILCGCDIVLDALDSIRARLAVQHAAARLRIPFVHAAIAGFVGEVMTVLPGDAGLEALYGEEGLSAEKGIEVSTGTPTATPIAVAALQSAEAVKIILGTGGVARDRALFLDLWSGTLSPLDLGGGR